MATARKLVTIAFLMLKNNEPYRYAKPETVHSKLAEARRHYAAKRRSLERDVPIEEAAAEEMPAHDADPDTASAERDEWDHYLRGLLPVERAIVRRLQAGYHQSEIATELGISERTVLRYVGKLLISNSLSRPESLSEDSLGRATQSDCEPASAAV